MTGQMQQGNNRDLAEQVERERMAQLSDDYRGLLSQREHLLQELAKVDALIEQHLRTRSAHATTRV